MRGPAYGQNEMMMNVRNQRNFDSDNDSIGNNPYIQKPIQQDMPVSYGNKHKKQIFIH